VDEREEGPKGHGDENQHTYGLGQCHAPSFSPIVGAAVSQPTVGTLEP
jgi:hypothetical protein